MTRNSVVLGYRVPFSYTTIPLLILLSYVQSTIHYLLNKGRQIYIGVLQLYRFRTNLFHSCIILHNFERQSRIGRALTVLS